MDIDLLSKMVKELILDNDRVVLPGLGSFVAEMVPSTFSDKGYTVNPPYRRLFFRSKPDEGDMLVRFYAESNNVTPELAERIIKDFISELRDVLHTKKTVLFPGLGRLRATKENNVFFVADEDLDIYPAGFGLEPISLKTHEEMPQDVTVAAEQLKPVADVSEESAPDVVEITDEEPIDLNIEEDVIPEGWDGPEQEPDQAAETEAVTEEEAAQPESETEPEPVHEPEQTPAPAQTSTPSPAPVNVPHKPAYIPQKKYEPTTSNKVLKGILIFLISLFALVVIYMLVMRIFPDFLNNVLYTPEELEIIHFR